MKPVRRNVVLLALIWLIYLVVYSPGPPPPNENEKPRFADPDVPKCSWSGHQYLYPPSDNVAFESTISALNEAGIQHFLIKGSLIGAYRHGGAIPCDGDMDIVFPVWLNGLATCEDASVPTLRGYEKGDEGQLTLCGKTRNEYVDETTSWIRERVPTIRSISPRPYGGMRVDFAGIGVDLVVSILDQAYLHKGPVCRCKFGSTEAICYEGSLELLKEDYGEDVLTPHESKRMCIQQQSLPSPEMKHESTHQGGHRRAGINRPQGRTK